jgi:TP901 family phage tail tape measure protein
MTAAVGGIALMTNQAAQFGGQMGEVFTLMPGASAEMKAKMSADVKDLSSQYGIMSEQVVPALYQAISAGVPSENVISFLGTASKTSIGGCTDLTSSVDVLTSTVNAYGSDVLSASDASDILFTGVRMGKTTMTELSANMSKVAPIAANLKVPLDQVVGSLDAMTLQGEPTAEAATKIKAMLAELSQEGSKSSEIFEQVGGKSFTAFIQGGGTLQQALQIMASASSQYGGSIKNEFGSIDAGMAALMLTSEAGAKAYGSAMDEMAKRTGAAENAYKEMSQTAQQQLNQLKADLHNQLLEIGEAFIPVLQNDVLPIIKNDLVPLIKDTVVPAIEDFAKWFSSLDEGGKKAVAGIGAFTFALGPLMMVLGPIVSSGGTLLSGLTRISTLASGLSGVGTSTVPLVTSLEKLAGMNALKVDQYVGAIGPAAAGATGEVGLLQSALVTLGGPVGIGAVVAVTAGIAAYTTNFADFRDNVNSIVKDIGDVAGDISTGDWESAGKDCAKALEDGFGTVGDLLIKGLPEANDIAKNLMTGMDAAGKSAAQALSSSFVSGASQLAEDAAKSGSAAVQAFINAMRGGDYSSISPAIIAELSHIDLTLPGQKAMDSLGVGMVSAVPSAFSPVKDAILQWFLNSGSLTTADWNQYLQKIQQSLGSTPVVGDLLASGVNYLQISPIDQAKEARKQKYEAWQASYNPVAPVTNSKDLNLEKNWVKATSGGQAVGEYVYLGKQDTADATAKGSEQGVKAAAPSLAEALIARGVSKEIANDPDSAKNLAKTYGIQVDSSGRVITSPSSPAPVQTPQQTTPQVQTPVQPTVSDPSKIFSEAPGDGTALDEFTVNPSAFLNRQLAKVFTDTQYKDLPAFENYLKKYGLSLKDQAKKWFEAEKAEGFGGKWDWETWWPTASKDLNKSLETTGDVSQAAVSPVEKLTNAHSEQTKTTTAAVTPAQNLASAQKAGASASDLLKDSTNDASEGVTGFNSNLLSLIETFRSLSADSFSKVKGTVKSASKSGSVRADIPDDPNYLGTRVWNPSASITVTGDMNVSGDVSGGISSSGAIGCVFGGTPSNVQLPTFDAPWFSGMESSQAKVASDIQKSWNQNSDSYYTAVQKITEKWNLMDPYIGSLTTPEDNEMIKCSSSGIFSGSLVESRFNQLMQDPSFISSFRGTSGSNTPVPEPANTVPQDPSYKSLLEQVDSTNILTQSTESQTTSTEKLNDKVCVLDENIGALNKGVSNLGTDVVQTYNDIITCKWGAIPQFVSGADTQDSQWLASERENMNLARKLQKVEVKSFEPNHKSADNTQIQTASWLNKLTQITNRFESALHGYTQEAKQGESSTQKTSAAMSLYGIEIDKLAAGVNGSIPSLTAASPLVQGYAAAIAAANAVIQNAIAEVQAAVASVGGSISLGAVNTGGQVGAAGLPSIYQDSVGGIKKSLQLLPLQQTQNFNVTGNTFNSQTGQTAGSVLRDLIAKGT